MNLRRRILSAQKYGAWSQPSRRRSTRRARKAEDRWVGREMEQGLDDELGSRFDDGPYSSERLAWDETVPGFATITIFDVRPDGSVRFDGIDPEAFLSRRAWRPPGPTADPTP